MKFDTYTHIHIYLALLLALCSLRSLGPAKSECSDYSFMHLDIILIVQNVYGLELCAHVKRGYQFLVHI